MTTKRTRLPALAAAVIVTACAGSSNGSGSGGQVAPAPAETATGTAVAPRIVQPGAPGQASRSFSAEELASVEGVNYTAADVAFMQGMIPHHAQALEMTALVRQYATTDAVRQMALRMEISQRDEIALMEGWLREHGEPIQMPGMAGMDGHGDMHGGHMMPGMLTPEQMSELANARGVEFDRLFLVGMIQHHQGAIDMVAKLFATPGAAQESTIFRFAEDVDADQAMEIARMQGVLADLPEESGHDAPHDNAHNPPQRGNR